MENNKIKIGKKICCVVFVVYVLALMKIILFKYIGVIPLFERIINGDLEGFRALNLIPFQSFMEFGKMLVSREFSRGFINLAGNMLVFAPFGWFLPLLFERCGKLKNVIFIGLGISCFFEFCQYFLYLGSADIDDVILNAAGVIFGFVCYKWVKKRTKDKAAIQYAITLILSMIGFVVAFIVAADYFGLMFGVGSKKAADKIDDQNYKEEVLEEFDNIQIETNAEKEFDIPGDIVSVEGDTLTVNQVMEVDENTALSSNDNRNLKTICLLPSTQYSRMDIYDVEGKKIETKTAKRDDLQEAQRIDIKGYMDGEKFFATEIVINNYLF